MNKKTTFWLVFGLIIIVGLSVALIYSIHKIKTTEENMVEIVEQMNYEKESLVGEYADVANELQGISGKVDDDALLQKLDEEQKKVQLLLDELRTTKATNTQRISELKKELASVRKVLSYYVAQVDSLNRVNTQLHTENQEVKAQYRQASETVETLSKEKETLTEQVTIAAQLEARDIVVEAQNDRGKNVNRVRNAELLKFSFTVGKNITAKVGERTIYLRIVTPDDNILIKRASDTFAFENKNIAYSCKKNFEYNGQASPQVLYWTVEETLSVGTYRVDIFVDGHMIGSQAFTLKK